MSSPSVALATACWSQKAFVLRSKRVPWRKGWNRTMRMSAASILETMAAQMDYKAVRKFGRLLRKFGIVSTFVDCYMSGRVSNLYIVLVTIDYEKPLEVLLHQNELLSEAKFGVDQRFVQSHASRAKAVGSILVKFGAPLDVKQYVDATIAHAEKREEIAVPTSAVVEDVGYAITNARIENATGAMSHMVATILLVYHRGISKTYLVHQANRLKLGMLRRRGRATTSLACIGIRDTLGTVVVRKRR
ncbi:unnamed protein product [Hyaloperonospora brassicae]|uniref:GPAT/DHAPAT C-terminal domain-containing protein n=1 Tax=Hyaloperonospora brassicae TaxID=162125 RepID=A0AAV0UU22_HYABA|nr:unnamed protein product [Hyaloperonospora brassicae]